jgi:nucleotide-binding universal stress UspA family protein
MPALEAQEDLMATEPIGPVVVMADGSSASIPAADLAAQEALIRCTHLVVLPATGMPPRSAEVIRTRLRDRYPRLQVDPDASGAAACLMVHTCAVPAVTPEVPLIVYRSAEVPADAPVVVGVSGVEESRSAVEFAFTDAALRGVPLVAVHVWAHPADTGPAGVHPSELQVTQTRTRADQVLTDALALCEEKYPQVEVRRQVRHGLDVAMALTAASRTARLVVVGVTAALLGGSSVAAVLVRRAGCPVALVPVG